MILLVFLDYFSILHIIYFCSSIYFLVLVWGLVYSFLVSHSGSLDNLSEISFLFNINVYTCIFVNTTFAESHKTMFVFFFSFQGKERWFPVAFGHCF